MKKYLFFTEFDLCFERICAVQIVSFYCITEAIKTIVVYYFQIPVVFVIATAMCLICILIPDGKLSYECKLKVWIPLFSWVPIFIVLGKIVFSWIFDFKVYQNLHTSL